MTPYHRRPYDNLLWAMFKGEQSDFVGTNGLLKSWKIWDELLEKSMSAPPVVYKVGVGIDELQLLSPATWAASTAGERVQDEL